MSETPSPFKLRLPYHYLVSLLHENYSVPHFNVEEFPNCFCERNLIASRYGCNVKNSLFCHGYNTNTISLITTATTDHGCSVNHTVINMRLKELAKAYRKNAMEILS